jgi:redox-sensitive bicupin YhaK (pirin superfamily)
MSDLVFETNVRYEDTMGAAGLLPEGGVEWFKAGYGAWYGDANAKGAWGFQLDAAVRPDGRADAERLLHQAT